MENTYKAILMKKIPLNNNKYLFKPEKTIFGEYDAESGIFDAGKDLYLNITDKELYKTDEEYGVVNIVPSNQQIPERAEKLFYYVDNMDNMLIASPYDIEGTAAELRAEVIKDYYKEMYSYTNYEQVLSDLMDTGFTEDQAEDLYNHYLSQLEDLENVINYLEELLPEFEDLDVSERKQLSNETINVKKLHEKITKTLIAQDKPALRVIAGIASLDLDNRNKFGMLVTGSSGVGKTKLLQLIAKNLDRPFLFIDSTQLTVPGIVGKDIEEYLWELYVSCGYDLEKAERAIILFDEIDKKRSNSNSDVSGRAVLNTLLKFLDGTTYSACENTQHKEPGTYVDINTSNMIVIASGAFEDLYHSPDKNISGFNTKAPTNTETKEVSVKDFIEKGQTPREFMRRMSVVVHLNDLHEKDYIDILNKSDESPTKIEQEKFQKLNTKLTFTDECIKKLGEVAYKKGLGVSGLVGEVEEIIWQPFVEVTSNKGEYEEVIITDKTVEDNNNYQLVKRKRSKRKSV
ncbi:MAG: AAA family ATPase [Firmicutes bacterium]|nr:AAA family ATPase [Bacillota bacterium]